MARTWPETTRKRALISAFDTVARPIARVLLRDKPQKIQKVRKILVLELWHMGDVVLSTSLLQSLREIYSDASITLLAKDHARELLQNSGLVDDIVTFDFPWTAAADKYDLSRYDRDAIARVVRELKERKFDISIDCRMDLRSNVLTRSIGAGRRVGYDFGGGGFLLTDTIPPPPRDQHKVLDWMALLEPLRDTMARDIPATPDPRLVVTEQERSDAARTLEASGINRSDIVVGIHPGGSHAAKRWSVDSFETVGRNLIERHGAKVVLFVDPEGSGSEMQLGPDALFVRTSIREMMALFTHCDFVICNDSGPMHAAAALGIPVVAIFRTGNPDAYGPRGANHRVVGNGAPWGETTDVAIDDVMDAAESMLQVVTAARPE